VRDEADREGTSVVIGPPGLSGAVAASETKGLEFDSVLVVDPARIVAAGPRGAAELYVALTRANPAPRRPATGNPLPSALTGLADLGTPRPGGAARGRLAVSGAAGSGLAVPGPACTRHRRRFQLGMIAKNCPGVMVTMRGRGLFPPPRRYQ